MPPPRAPARPARARRRCAGVMVREVVNFSSFWRSSTFSSTVDPTIYLLAFGFGFGSLVSTGRRATTTSTSSAPGSSPPRCCSRAHSPRCTATFVKYEFQHTYDAILAAPVDTEELVTGEALWIAHAHRDLRLRADARGDAASGSSRAWGMLLVPFIAALAGFGWACFGIFIAARSKSIESFSYWQSGLLTPLFLVAGTFFPLSRLPDLGAGAGQLQSAVPLRPARPRTRCSAPRTGRTSGISGSCSVRAGVLAPGDPLHGTPAHPLIGRGAGRCRRVGRDSGTALHRTAARGCVARATALHPRNRVASAQPRCIRATASPARGSAGFIRGYREYFTESSNKVAAPPLDRPAHHHRPVVPGKLTARHHHRPVVPGKLTARHHHRPVVPGKLTARHHHRPVVPGKLTAPHRPARRPTSPHSASANPRPRPPSVLDLRPRVSRPDPEQVAEGLCAPPLDRRRVTEKVTAFSPAAPSTLGQVVSATVGSGGSSSSTTFHADSNRRREIRPAITPSTMPQGL